MRRIVSVLTLALALASPAAAAAPLSVQVDRTSVSTTIGHRFRFETTIHNSGSAAQPVVAHLNVLSLEPSVYVDPEDWSSRRTRYLGTLAPTESRSVRWTVQAVNSGRFVLYVTAVNGRGLGSMAVSEPVRASVAHQRTLNAGGVVPLAFGMPALLGVAFLLVRRRRRARA